MRKNGKTHNSTKRGQNLNKKYVKNFIRKNGLTIAQEESLCAIQKAISENDYFIIDGLPEDTAILARFADSMSNKYGINPYTEALDAALIESVKNNWKDIKRLCLVYDEIDFSLDK